MSETPKTFDLTDAEWARSAKEDDAVAKLAGKLKEAQLKRPRSPDQSLVGVVRAVRRELHPRAPAALLGQVAEVDPPLLGVRDRERKRGALEGNGRAREGYARGRERLMVHTFSAMESAAEGDVPRSSTRDERRASSLQVLMTPDERALIDSAAQDAGIPTGAWMRMVSIREAKRVIREARASNLSERKGK